MYCMYFLNRLTAAMQLSAEWEKKPLLNFHLTKSKPKLCAKFCSIGKKRFPKYGADLKENKRKHPQNCGEFVLN